jgi:PHD/YefM family antitoxin component YafN of YafNO toxin-antitoxin module
MSTTAFFPTQNLAFVQLTQFRSEMTAVIEKLQRAPIGLVKGLTKRPVAVILAYDEYEPIQRKLEAFEIASDQILGEKARLASQDMMSTDETMASLASMAAEKGIDWPIK